MHPHDIFRLQRQQRAQQQIQLLHAFPSAQDELQFQQQLHLRQVHQQHQQEQQQLLLQQQQQQQQQQQYATAMQMGVLARQPMIPYEPGSCTKRLMQYMFHQRHRPSDNNIHFWRRVVAEYFAPGARKRWCVSRYASGGNQLAGVFSQEVWQCEICGAKPGRGFETTVEVLPRLCKIKYESGILEELLFVDLPYECRLPSGLILVEYAKVIHESIFEHLRIVRNGQLRLIFSPDLKILSWQLCARSHEELLPRRLIVPQVSQLASIAHRYQASSLNGAHEPSSQDLESQCRMFMTSSQRLVRNLEVPIVNDLGYTKRYVRCLQISEVVNSMKSLIDFSCATGLGPIASLINFPRQNVKPEGQNCSHVQAVIQATSSDQNNVPVVPEVRTGSHVATDVNTVSSSFVPEGKPVDQQQDTNDDFTQGKKHQGIGSSHEYIRGVKGGSDPAPSSSRIKLEDGSNPVPSFKLEEQEQESHQAAEVGGDFIDLTFD